MKKLPILYRILLDRLKEASFKNEISMREAKDIISRRYKVRKRISSGVIKELKELGLLIQVNHQKISVID